MRILRQSVMVNCPQNGPRNACQASSQVCLFNIRKDPCERNNVVFQFPDVVKIMERTLEMYKATEIPRGNKPIDPRADPKFFNYTWTNWWDIVNDQDGQDEATLSLRENFKNPEHIFTQK